MKPICLVIIYPAYFAVIIVHTTIPSSNSRILIRKPVIDLLDKLIELNREDKFTNEDIIHSLFFPIRESNNSITSEKQNLWLLDERLTFNSLLASDKLLKEVKELNSDSSNRIDLVKDKKIYMKTQLYFQKKKYLLNHLP